MGGCKVADGYGTMLVSDHILSSGLNLFTFYFENRMSANKKRQLKLIHLFLPLDLSIAYLSARLLVVCVEWN